VLAHAGSPLAAAVQAAGGGGVAPVVRVGGALASLGALLALLAGVGRTSLAMARNGDLPSWLAAVHPRLRVPHHAEIALAVVVGLLVLAGDLRAVIGFSSFGVLVYYGIANASALRQPRAQRRWPRAVNVLGGVGCAVLALSLPAAALIAGAVVVAAGLAGRLLLRPRTQS
jgi:APA family basic amino acid/polyamine antiporter